MKGIFFIISFLLVAFGQPASLSYLGPFSALFGYALFWFSIRCVSSKGYRFLISLFWFAAIQAVWISWMTSTAYTGSLMFVVYGFFILLLSCEFALLSMFVPSRGGAFSLKRVLVLASIATIFEWSHLFILVGYTFNPLGLSLTTNSFSLQFVSVIGVLGLSFWVMLTNLLVYRLTTASIEKRKIAVVAVIAILPYLFGAYALANGKISKRSDPANDLNVILVQPNFFPENKEPIVPFLDKFIPPLRQWQRIFQLIETQKTQDVDLIVLPESAVTFQASQAVYPMHLMKRIWHEVYSDTKDPFSTIPMHLPFALEKEGKWFVSNLYFAQALANFYQSELIIGLDDTSTTSEKVYNQAFFLQPNLQTLNSYAKRKLVPLTEYFPFAFCSELAKKYGIYDSFSAGKEIKNFTAKKTPFSVSICYEETFGHQMTLAKKMGASLLVNISNDVWFPSSSLALQHYSLGRLRCVENGLPLLRSCNTGLTVALDAYGKEINKATLEVPQAIKAAVPIESHFTLYSIIGDWLILGVCFGILLFALGSKLFQFINSKK